MKRPSLDEYYLNIAKVVSERSTCLKKHYGCVIVKNGEVISTGYNGNVRGESHCVTCTKASGNGDMEEYSQCAAVHAEMNAIISASRTEMLGADLYLAGYTVKTGEPIECASWPCEICLRLIKNAGIARVINSTGVIYMRLNEDPNSELIQLKKEMKK
jgi:dCMP deaminase